jgi:hypothetical protein
MKLDEKYELILEAIRRRPHPYRTSDVCRATGLSRTIVERRLWRLRKSGLIRSRRDEAGNLFWQMGHPKRPGPIPNTPEVPETHDAGWRIALDHADKLARELEALSNSAGAWSPEARKRAEASLVAAKKAIERQLKHLRGMK